MRRGPLIGGCGALALLVLAGPGTLRAQEEPAYPHGAFEDDCTLCHSSEGWTPAVIGPEFDHSERGMPLLGAHAQTECRACHVSLEFDRLEPVCVSCHLDVHRNELGTDCGQCHTSRSFIDRSMMIRAHLSTRFPLRGTHRTLDCEDCHAPGGGGSLQYVKTPVECAGCHLDTFLAATNPDHQAAGFPQTCESCHSTAAWLPAGFNHNTLAAGVQCASCHLDDFLATTNPDHQGAGFSQECQLCHSTRVWVPAAFDGLNHDGQFFPIFSGKHKGKWQACSDCHANSSDFSQFSCLNCHKHDDPVQVADQHQGVSGYQYDSQACYGCHPQGSH